MIIYYMWSGIYGSHDSIVLYYYNKLCVIQTVNLYIESLLELAS